MSKKYKFSVNKIAKLLAQDLIEHGLIVPKNNEVFTRTAWHIFSDADKNYIEITEAAPTKVKNAK
jgi:5,10-methenyltetrahydromethanopterin hydrogenase